MSQNREDRDLTTHEQFQRADSWSPASLLPEFKKVPGWAYRWIRVSLTNQADNLNVSSKMREGWEPVKLADHPEIRMVSDANAKYKDGIEIGGLLLCKIPEEFIDQRTAYINKQTESQTQAIDNSFMKDNDPRMGKFSDKKSTTSFGKGK
jgi:hypothetical protein